MFAYQQTTNDHSEQLIAHQELIGASCHGRAKSVKL
jgi:hypothetical protein